MKALYIIKDIIKRKIIDLGRRSGRLKTPMDMVILSLKAYKLLPANLTALEVFGMHGLWITYDYANLCDYLELWEVNPMYAKYAKKFLPMATVRVGDSIEAANKGNLLRNDYNFVVIDNPISGPYNSEKYCEHFDLFPALLERIADKTVFIMNTVLDMEKIAIRYPSLAFQEWTIRRKKFYEIQNDDEVKKIQVETLVDIYRNKFNKWAVDVNYILFIPRDDCVGFLVVAVNKR